MIAARRLLRNLQGLADVEMVVSRIGGGSDNQVVLSPYGVLERLVTRIRYEFENMPLHPYPNREKTVFSAASVPSNLPRFLMRRNPDVVHLHWVTAGFVSVEAIGRIRSPIVWTLHDSWAFTGGCHVPDECQRYRAQCGCCPKLGSSNESDLSRRTFRRKQSSWDLERMTMVTPSNWLRDCALNSALFRTADIRVIPNGIDTDAFMPIDRQVARAKLDLPQNKRIVLFGAMKATESPNKGYPDLCAALDALYPEKTEDVMLLVFGAEAAHATPRGIETRFVGTQRDESRLRLLYSAANLFVLPSHSENLPNTILESMACGTPAVAYRLGGIPEIIDHGRNGFLAEPRNIEDLSHGILSRPEPRDGELSLETRPAIEERFSQARQATQYLDLYEEVR